MGVASDGDVGAASDVIVLGAGAAGLACASVLDGAGLRTTVVEARDRVGGRVLTVRPPGAALPVELGAEFVHGSPPEILALAAEANVPLVPVSESSWVADGSGLRPATHYDGDVGQVLGAMDGGRDPDRPVADFLAEWRARHPDRARAAERARHFIEGFHAADVARASERALAHESELAEEHEGSEEQDFRVPDGYDRLLQHLRGRLGPRTTLLLESPATAVRWSAGRVEVEHRTRDGGTRRIAARALVITLPLAVLQLETGDDDALRITPEPPGKRAALAGIGMGDARRVVLRLREPLWERPSLRAPGVSASPADLGFLQAPHASIPVWWPPSPIRDPRITGWIGGPRATALAGRSEEEMVALAVGALAETLRMPRDEVAAQVVAGHTHDWTGDRWSRGAYSYTLVGGIDARRALAAPTAGTLFWAGEATHDGGAVGTVHGALASGYRAAGEVIAKVEHRAQRVRDA